jgi:hypothetical protein
MITDEMFECINAVADKRNIPFNDVLISCENVMRFHLFKSSVLPKEIFEMVEEIQLMPLDKEIYDEVMHIYQHQSVTLYK